MLEALKLVRLSAGECFKESERALPFTILDFWVWSGSDLVGNTLRGAMAEFLVARALGIATDVRDEWNAWDLETADGLRIEVKCSGYVQAWAQKSLSTPSFGIAPRAGWTRTRGEFSNRQARWSDLFVFALHSHRDKPTADPLDLAQWQFLVIPTSTIDERCGKQKKIAPSSLPKLGGEWVTYAQLRATFERTVSNMPAPVRAPDDPAR